MKGNFNTNVIIVLGKISSGKDTVAKLINEILYEYNKDTYEQRAFATKLKEFAAELTGIPYEGWLTQEDKEKELGHEWDTWDQNGLKIHMTRRLFLQKLGSDACIAKLHKHTWINALFASWTPKSKWIITDGRFPDEIQAVKEKNGVTIRITRKNKHTNSTHISETALDGYNNFDFNIVNEGTMEELKDKVKSILSQLKMI